MKDSLVNDRFLSMGIPMLEKMKSEKLKTEEKYQNLLKTKKVFTVSFTSVKMEAECLQFIDGDIRVMMKRSEIFKNDVTVNMLQRYIGRRFAVLIQEIDGNDVYVSHKETIVGDRSIRSLTLGKIRKIVGINTAALDPFRAELHERANTEAREKLKGAKVSEGRFNKTRGNCYYNLYEKKKSELIEAGVASRCNVKATVASVGEHYVIVNIFDLDIYGIITKENWSAAGGSVILKDVVNTGDVIDTEVLYQNDGFSGNDNLSDSWVCSRRNISGDIERAAFKEILKNYSVGDVVAAIVREVIRGNATKFWVGTVKGTHYNIRCKHRGGMYYNVGSEYLVKITKIDSERCVFFGQTIRENRPENVSTTGIEKKGRSVRTKGVVAEPKEV